MLVCEGEEQQRDGYRPGIIAEHYTNKLHLPFTPLDSFFGLG